MSMAGAEAAQARTMRIQRWATIICGSADAVAIGAGLGSNTTTTSRWWKVERKGTFCTARFLTHSYCGPSPISNGSPYDRGRLFGIHRAFNAEPRFITPNSELSFDIYARDFVINLHDRFSITERQLPGPTVAGTGAYSQFQNSLGISALWDFEQAGRQCGLRHASYLALTGGAGQPDRPRRVFPRRRVTRSTGHVVGHRAWGGLLHNSIPARIPRIRTRPNERGPFFQTRSRTSVLQGNVGLFGQLAQPAANSKPRRDSARLCAVPSPTTSTDRGLQPELRRTSTPA